MTPALHPQRSTYSLVLYLSATTFEASPLLCTRVCLCKPWPVLFHFQHARKSPAAHSCLKGMRGSAPSPCATAGARVTRAAAASVPKTRPLAWYRHTCTHTRYLEAVGMAGGGAAKRARAPGALGAPGPPAGRRWAACLQRISRRWSKLPAERCISRNTARACRRSVLEQRGGGGCAVGVCTP